MNVNSDDRADLDEDNEKEGTLICYIRNQNMHADDQISRREEVHQSIDVTVRRMHRLMLIFRLKFFLCVCDQGQKNTKKKNLLKDLLINSSNNIVRSIL